MTEMVERVGIIGEAHKYRVSFDDGRCHHFVVSHAERAVDGDNGEKAVARAVASYRLGRPMYQLDMSTGHLPMSQWLWRRVS